MVSNVTINGLFVPRKDYGKIETVIPIPNLINIQIKSFEKFFDQNSLDYDNSNLQAIFKSIFPINDFTDLSSLEFVNFRCDEPKFSVQESKKRGATYSVPIKATLRLIVWFINEDTGNKEIKSIKEQEVFMGELPVITPKGTFVVNGTERVVVSQLHRSPGVFFDHDKGKATNQAKLLYSARVIPYRGSWLDFEFDTKDILFFRVDRRRKLHATIFLKALGMSDQDIISEFYVSQKAIKSDKDWIISFNSKDFKGRLLDFDIVHPDTKKIIFPKGNRLTARDCREIDKKNISQILVSNEYFLEKAIFETITHNEQVLYLSGEKLNEDNVLNLEKLEEFNFIDIVSSDLGAPIIDTLSVDKTLSKDEALIELFKVIKPGDPPVPEAAAQLLESLFFRSERYDLSDVGRVKINERLSLDIDESVTLLTIRDVLETVRTLISLKINNYDSDDIDHLGNRRVRSVGELVENQFRVGLVRVQRAIQERMNSLEIDTVLPQDLVNVKPLSASLREFFGTSQLSQFMDQTNPLSEITHKRRLSALGPGGLSRDRAGFEVRDVHTSHYGRICPIETPEGPNIGLINSIATYAVVNKYGFLITPYRKVENGIVKSEIEYLSAVQETRYTIAQANAVLDKKGKFKNELINCRSSGNYIMADPQDIDFIDLSPKQVVSVAAALIPFLENDDANRALMGSNMQRQAVPLLYPQAPLVGTGMEKVVASDSSACVVANNAGVVEVVNSKKILVASIDENGFPLIDEYALEKFTRSNMSTCFNQTPVVSPGQIVKKGDILSDGPSTKNGELALGANILVGFTSWNGYNFEDSIIISEKVFRDDVFTSLHVEEFEMVVRDTRLGAEEVTRDVPNISEDAIRNLDEVGVITIGSEVRTGDVLVGKVTPKSESPITPEEKLLKAIFGDKAQEVKDSSLYVSPGVKGTVVDVRVFTRRGVTKCERTLMIEKSLINDLSNSKDQKIRLISNSFLNICRKMLEGKELSKALTGVKAGSKLTKSYLETISVAILKKIILKDSKSADKLEQLIKKYDQNISKINVRFNNDIEKIQYGDDLPQGVLKIIKIFVVVKRRLQPGDKMAGRHGNKGVISKIVPIEDMPYLSDGTPLDVLLNPLGVPSRMNVGQILETHLGFASYSIGKKINELINQEKRKNNIHEVKDVIKSFYDDTEISEYIDKMSKDQFVKFAEKASHGIPVATPVFDGAKEADIVKALEVSGAPTSGQVDIFDGFTGEKFDRKVTIGHIYILKLHHLVDEKIHARSIGPYSLVTQQPLGGKAHFGGQRFGEMECWALQAYGASFTLQEILTVKSDDTQGRIKLYESIIKSDSNFNYGIPESFNVMVKELRSLGLNIDLSQTE
jgi:DNA-directed RNA polymerase subunit beta